MQIDLKRILELGLVDLISPGLTISAKTSSVAFIEL